MKSPGELVLELAEKLENEALEVDKKGNGQSTIARYAVKSALKSSAAQVRELGQRLVQKGS